MATELPKAYDAKAAQEKWLTFWEERGYFHADPAGGGEPPTGSPRTPPPVPGEEAVHYRDSAAERDRRVAHGPRA